jgi:deoxyribonuclease-2
MRTTLFVLSAFSLYSARGFPTCKADNGGAVDLWVAFKGPKGTQYVYYDPATPLGASKHDMNSTTVGALGTTLQQLWSEATTDYIIWNDEPVGASGYNFTTGHTKGVWAWNTATGDAIILQHSIPLFPAGPSQVDSYAGLGSNAWMYGQHAACFSTHVSELEHLASLAPLTIPSIYDSRVGTDTPTALAALASGAASNVAQCFATSFTTVGGQNVTYFAKSTQWSNELYAECIAPTLQISLSVESWIRGSAEGPSCGAFDVLDVKGVSYPGGLAFDEYNDHSKWATGGSLFCASDINRMTTQFERGGAAYCWVDAELSGAVSDAITGTDSCN